jgi:hypothetical protein
MMQAVDFLADDAAVLELVQRLGDVFRTAVANSSTVEQATSSSTVTTTASRNQKQLLPSCSTVCTYVISVAILVSSSRLLIVTTVADLCWGASVRLHVPSKGIEV